MEAKRAEKDEYLKGQNEVQRQLNDCMAYKRNKQAEDDLGRRIDQLDAQMRDVSRLPAAVLMRMTYCPYCHT